MTTENSIDIQALTLQVQGKFLLRNFSAHIVPAERIGIFGPNGAGKSTFLKSLMGVFPAASGRILLHGKPMHTQCKKIAYLPQEFDELPMDYSVMGFLTLLASGSAWGLPWDTHQKQCEAVLQQVSALHLQHKLFKRLSGGEKKRVMLAALLLETPEILLLDEPLANLDPRYQHELLQLIDTLQQTLRLTVLITAHDFNPLLHMLDRVMFMGEGDAVLDEPARVIQSDVLSQLYKTPLQVISLQGRQWVLSGQQEVFFNPVDHCHGEFCHVSV